MSYFFGIYPMNVKDITPKRKDISCPGKPYVPFALFFMFGGILIVGVLVVLLSPVLVVSRGGRNRSL